MDLPTPHTYIVAVSGGVDSCVLLHMIHSQYSALPEILREDPHIVVAHVNHGIRENSSRDLDHVKSLAEKYGYEFESINLNLGPNTSEEQAREKRYEFLDSLVSKYHADAVVTAHHKDDVLETAIINISRGTGRRGLSSLRSRQGRCRPLLELTKREILEYATVNKVEWNEDETNSESKYLRNRVRSALDTADDAWKESFATHLQKISATNEQLDVQIATLLQYRLKGRPVLSRNWFVKLDHMTACECMVSFLKKFQVQNIDKNLVDKLVIALKASSPGTKLDVDKTTIGLITKRSLRLIDRQTLKTRTI